MGQRLIITCKYKGKNIANIYYHWSAYTISALYEAQELLDCIGTNLPNMKIEDLQLMLIKFVESHGGGISGGQDSDEWKYITNKFPYATFKSDGISRNQGLIAISDKGMKDNASWGEGDLIIDFDNQIISNECWYCMNLKEYVDEYLEGDDSDLYLPSIDIDLTNINFNDINSTINTLDSIDSYMLPNEDAVIHLIG